MKLNRYFQSAGCLAAILMPTVSIAADPDDVYFRSLAFVYSKNGTLDLPYSDKELLGYFDEVPGGLTSLIPFFENEPNPLQYKTMIHAVKKRGITLIPAFGDYTASQINSTTYKNVVQQYRKFTDYVRIENFAPYYNQKNGPEYVDNMLDYLINTLKFHHIMLNEWPRLNGSAVPSFSQSQVDAVFVNVLLDQTGAPNYKVIYTDRDSYENWYPGNAKYIAEIRSQANPSVNVLINYEAPPQQAALANLEQQFKNSTSAMNITINKILEFNDGLYWVPPFQRQYDPIKLGTWKWIYTQLGNL